MKTKRIKKYKKKSYIKKSYKKKKFKSLKGGMSKEQCYKLLDIAPNTTDESVIRKAFLKQALLYHPDKLFNKEEEEKKEKEEKFKKISEAYNILMVKEDKTNNTAQKENKQSSTYDEKYYPDMYTAYKKIKILIFNENTKFKELFTQLINFMSVTGNLPHRRLLHAINGYITMVDNLNNFYNDTDFFVNYNYETIISYIDTKINTLNLFDFYIKKDIYPLLKETYYVFEINPLNHNNKDNIMFDTRNIFNMILFKIEKEKTSLNDIKAQVKLKKLEKEKKEREAKERSEEIIRQRQKEIKEKADKKLREEKKREATKRSEEQINQRQEEIKEKADKTLREETEKLLQEIGINSEEMQKLQINKEDLKKYSKEMASIRPETTTPRQQPTTSRRQQTTTSRKKPTTPRKQQTTTSRKKPTTPRNQQEILKAEKAEKARNAMRESRDRGSSKKTF